MNEPQKLGRHLSNIVNPKSRCWQLMLRCPEEHKERAEWIADNVIGPPMASECFTVKQLENMGYVGLYASEKTEKAIADREAEKKEHEGIQ